MSIVPVCGRHAPLWSLAFALCAYSCKHPESKSSRALGDEGPTTAKITVIGMNDLHGTIEASKVSLTSGLGVTTATEVGGLDYIAGYFDVVRERNPSGTLILDAGDAYQGTMVSNTFEGQSIVQAYNALKIDASTFGNHDFDYGVIKDPSTSPDGEHPQGALLAILRSATFPYLSVNVRKEGDQPLGFPNVSPSKVFERDGIKIGVIGASTIGTPDSSAPQNLTGLMFKKLIDSVPAEAERLRREEKVQLVILVTHAGGLCDMKLPPEAGDRACAMPVTDEVTEFLRALPLKEQPLGTVDLVVAGHMHLPQAHFISTGEAKDKAKPIWASAVPVVQTTGFGRSFSMIELTVRPDADPLAPREERILGIKIHPQTYFCHEHHANYASCNPDEEKTIGPLPPDLGKVVDPTLFDVAIKPRDDLAAVLIPFQKKVKDRVEAKVTVLPKALTLDRTRESSIANCIADTVKEGYETEAGSEIDLVMINSGSVRAPLPQGEINFGALFAVLPFDAKVTELLLNPEELEGFGKGLSKTPKSVAVVSAGWTVKLTRDPRLFPKHRGFVRPSGLAAGAMVRVVTNDFNAFPGGEHDAVFKKARAEGRIKPSKFELLGLVEHRLQRKDRALPASCAGGPLGRTALVP